MQDGQLLAAQRSSPHLPALISLVKEEEHGLAIGGRWIEAKRRELDRYGNVDFGLGCGLHDGSCTVALQVEQQGAGGVQFLCLDCWLGNCKLDLAARRECSSRHRNVQVAWHAASGVNPAPRLGQ